MGGRLLLRLSAYQQCVGMFNEEIARDLGAVHSLGGWMSTELHVCRGDSRAAIHDLIGQKRVYLRGVIA